MAAGPISPKAHGAWLGSGSGAAVTNVVIGLLQQYVTHAPLASSLVTALYVVVPGLLAFTGAWLAPSLQQAEAQITPEERVAIQQLLTILGRPATAPVPPPAHTPEPGPPPAEPAVLP